jgi:putative ABC transport system ATP-binding protein
MVMVAPPIWGSTAIVFTTLRESDAIHNVVVPGSPSADVISAFQALNVPAGTVTVSEPTTLEVPARQRRPHNRRPVANVLVRLDRVSKAYTEGEESRLVLQETSGTFGEGEITAIRGRSGSGKSTLLNLVAGIDSPTAGDVFVDGICVNRLSTRDRTLLRRERMGFVFQFFNLIPTLSVLENVLLPAELAGRPPGASRERARGLLDRVGLLSRAGAFPDRLSGGEQQRVAIARALVQDPRLVLADEPTGNLDDHTGEAVMALLEQVTRDAGKSLLLVTHSTRVAARADRELTIEDGHLMPQRG